MLFLVVLAIQFFASIISTASLVLLGFAISKRDLLFNIIESSILKALEIIIFVGTNVIIFSLYKMKIVNWKSKFR